jgi:hypothetical protein
MNVKSDRPAVKRLDRSHGKRGPARTKMQVAEWEITNERLDEALEHTFPASDALSIVQTVRSN